MNQQEQLEANKKADAARQAVEVAMKNRAEQGRQIARENADWDAAQKEYRRHNRGVHAPHPHAPRVHPSVQKEKI